MNAPGVRHLPLEMLLFVDGLAGSLSRATEFVVVFLFLCVVDICYQEYAGWRFF